MIFEAHLEYHINTMVFILAISHGIIIMVYIMACDAGRTTVLLIVMECKLNAVLAFASEKKRQTNKSVIHRKSLSASSLKRARLIINMFRLPSRFPAFWPFRLNSSPSFWILRCDGSVCQRRCLGWFHPVRFFFLSTLLSAPRLNCLYSHSPSAFLDPSSRR